MAIQNIDVADKTTLDAVKAKTDLIGTATDTGGSETTGTVMGKLNKAIANTNNITVDLSGVNSNTNVPLDTLITQQAGQIKAQITNKGIVKSVQRGITDKDSSNYEITISSVNPNKCLVLLNGFPYELNGSHNLYVISLTSTRLTVRTSGVYASSWQVIEFY